MKDCWVSPYGEVVYIEENGIWLHAKTAAEILNERYNYNLNIYDPNVRYLDILHDKGWIRYSKYMVGYTGGCKGGWIYNPFTITRDQKDKVFDLTGEVIE